MLSVKLFLQKYKLELMVILVLLLIPFIEPIFEVLVDCIFTIGRYIGTWIRNVSVGKMC